VSGGHGPGTARGRPRRPDLAAHGLVADRLPPPHCNRRRVAPRLTGSPPAPPPDGSPQPLSARLRPYRYGAAPSASDRGVARQRHLAGAGAGGLPVSRVFEHEPVMLAEVLELFEPVPDGLLLDATVGGAGHAAALLASRPGLVLVGLDRDPVAVAAAAGRLAAFGARARVLHARFDQLGDVVDPGRSGFGALPLVGALFDLGVSSHQLDAAERGFSFRDDAPLDMRMDPSAGRSAAELVASASEEELASLFAAHGEQRFASRIARAVVAARPLTRTGQLAEVVAAAVPAAARRRGHPARRVFQALRVAVNEELDQLRPALEAAVSRLVAGGRAVVLAYHSGEDRVVKATFAELASGGCTCPPGLPCVCGATPTVRLLTRGARKPGPGEVARNPRSSSARLRAVQRLAEDG
jgi:16S rRNA (cytosine1402-N4)-methyltransferase